MVSRRWDPVRKRFAEPARRPIPRDVVPSPRDVGPSPRDAGTLSKGQKKRIVKAQRKVAEERGRLRAVGLINNPLLESQLFHRCLPKGNRNPGKSQRIAARRKRDAILTHLAAVRERKLVNKAKGIQESSQKTDAPKTPRRRKSTVPGLCGTSPNIVEAFKRVEQKNLLGAKKNLSSALDSTTVSRQITYHSLEDDPNVEVVEVLIAPKVKKADVAKSRENEDVSEGSFDSDADVDEMHRSIGQQFFRGPDHLVPAFGDEPHSDVGAGRGFYGDEYHYPYEPGHGRGWGRGRGMFAPKKTVATF